MIYKDFEGSPVIFLDSANVDHLLKLSKLATLKAEIVKWLDENIGIDNWEFHRFGMIQFNQKEDAMAFLLRWS